MISLSVLPFIRLTTAQHSLFVLTHFNSPITFESAAQAGLGLPLLSNNPKWFSWGGNDLRGCRCSARFQYRSPYRVGAHLYRHWQHTPPDHQRNILGKSGRWDILFQI